MKATAVICEYNPLTNGHLYHIEKAKEQTGADTVVAVMSGSFTQRGDAAVADKYQRASVAARLGCDIVIELPTVFAISPADNFAYGAMRIIKELPFVDTLSFGSECGDVDKLKKLAELLADEPSELKEGLARYLAEGDSFPKARAKAANEFMKLHEEFSELYGIIDEPNNVLAIAYINAARVLNYNINFHTVKRIGGGYNDESGETEYPSASAVRAAIRQGNLPSLQKAVHPFSYNLLESCSPGGTSLGDLVLFRLKEITATELASYYDISGGLHNRIKIAANSANTYESFLEEAKTKKYTLARLKRISLYALLGITKELYELAVTCDPYIFILALNKQRKDILTELYASAKNVLVRYSDIDKTDKQLRPLIKLDFKAQGVLSIVNHSNYFNKSMLLV